MTNITNQIKQHYLYIKEKGLFPKKLYISTQTYEKLVEEIGDDPKKFMQGNILHINQTKIDHNPYLKDHKIYCITKKEGN
jgi:hypothetical protein